MNFLGDSRAQKTAISVLELIENKAIFQLSWVSSRLGTNFVLNSRGSENGDSRTRVT